MMLPPLRVVVDTAGAALCPAPLEDDEDDSEDEEEDLELDEPPFAKANSTAMITTNETVMNTMIAVKRRAFFWSYSS